MTIHKATSVVIVTHKFVTHPDDELVSYLNKKKLPRVLHICHSFYEAPDRKSYCKRYTNGLLEQTLESGDFKGYPEVVIYLKELFYTLWWVIKDLTRWDVYIGMDGLCTFFGSLLKSVGFVKKTIYWAIDFVPKNRFDSALKNWIYLHINTHGYTHADEMWDLSPRMAAARKEYIGIPIDSYRKLRVVPYGMWVNRIKKYQYDECQKYTAVFMGRIIESQGAQLIIQAIPLIIQKIPDFHLKIIGDGPYKTSLEALAKSLKVDKYCTFFGKIPDHRVLEDEIAKSAIALAPYIKKLDKWSYYADPGKVKTYLACGVPVLLTNITWNAIDIEKNNCGRIIDDSPESIYNAVIEILRKHNPSSRTSAVNYALRFDYSTLFKEL